MTTLAEALIDQLEGLGVEVVFGIPGVHTIELYRGLKHSSIRHYTPRMSKAQDLWPMAMRAPPENRVYAC